MAITGPPPSNQAMVEYRRGFLVRAIGSVRMSLGAPDCATCKHRWDVFMRALAIAVRAGAFAADLDDRNAFVDEFIQYIEDERKKGHAKASGG